MKIILFLIYLSLINTLGIGIMHIDKERAKKRRWRIPEINLFAIAILLGSPGVLLGMYAFHHKTKHMKFVMGIPFILLIQLSLFYKLNLFKYFNI